MNDEFDITSLNELIDTALADPSGDNRSGQPVVLQRTRQAVPLPLSLLNTAHFQQVAEILDTYLGRDAQMALDDLRRALFERYDLGDLPTFHAVVDHCRACPGMSSKPYRPLGNLADPDLVLVHEYMPGPQAIEEKFNPILRTAGFDPRRVAHTACIRCRISERRSPTATELDNCQRYLFAEIQLLQPKLIMTLGATAFREFFGHDADLASNRGTVCWLGPWPILSTYAPGFVQQREAIKEVFQSDFRTANTFCYGRLPRGEVMRTPETS